MGILLPGRPGPLTSTSRRDPAVLLTNLSFLSGQLGGAEPGGGAWRGEAGRVGDGSQELRTLLKFSGEETESLPPHALGKPLVEAELEAFAFITVRVSDLLVTVPGGFCFAFYKMYCFMCVTVLYMCAPYDVPGAHEVRKSVCYCFLFLKQEL